MQQVQNRRSLRDMAETVAGYVDDEMRRALRIKLKLYFVRDYFTPLICRHIRC